MGDTFFATAIGDITSTNATVIVPWGDGIEVLGEVGAVGRVHTLGAFTQTDSYLDVVAWRSDDGIEWVESVGPGRPGAFDEWVHAAIPFGDGVVAVGATRAAGTTPTQVGASWTLPTDDEDPSVWISAGTPPVWERIESESFAGERFEIMHDVVAVGGLLVAVGESAQRPPDGTFGSTDYDGAVWTSPDGREWTRVEDAAAVFSGPEMDTSFRAAASVGDTALAFGVDRSGFSHALGVWSSSDGVTWERVTVDGDGARSSDYLVVDGAAASELGVVVVGNEFGNGFRRPAVWYSPDGTSWQRADLGGEIDGELRSVTATEFGFVAVGYEPDATLPLVLLSGDGIHWYRDTSAQLALEGADTASGWAVATAGGRVVLTATIRFIGYESAVYVWSGPVGAGATPEAAGEPAGESDGPEPAALADAEAAADRAEASALEAIDVCPEAIEAMMAEIAAGATEGNEETGQLLLQCSVASEAAESAALEAEELAARIENTAPGSDDAREAAAAATRARTAVDRLEVALAELAEALDLGPTP